MNLFISDNSFFLTGLRQQAIFQNGNILFYHAKEALDELVVSSEDVIALHVSDVLLRYRILHRLGNAGCRVILLLKMISQHEYVYNGRFPWLVSDKITPRELFFALDRAGRSVLRQRRISEKDAFIIRSLCKGRTILQLSVLLGLSEKYIYSLRKNLVSDYSLHGHNAVTTLLCRDIIKLSKTISS